MPGLHSVILRDDGQTDLAINCPQCDHLIQRQMARSEWMYYDPVCPECGTFFAGLYNPYFFCEGASQCQD